ncbi:MAG: hypothetical protein AAGB22_14005 [Bacteroidota bacterium]
MATLIIDWDDTNQRSAAVGTTLFHALLFLAFILMAMLPDEPEKFEETAIDVMLDFGTTEEGSGEVEPETVGAQATPAESTPAPVEPVSETVAASESVVTQTTESTVAAQETAEPEPEPEQVEPQRTLNKQLANVLKKETFEQTPTETSGDPGASEGASDNVIGNRGQEHGNPDGKAAIGGPNDGTSFNLSGRKLLKVGIIKSTVQQSGRIVVDIIVDRKGNVIRAQPGARGTTITNQSLLQKAREAALKTKFSTNSRAAEEQKGSITFEIILN